MTEAAPSEAGGSPFSPRAVLALVLLGGAVFVLLLWTMGAGLMGGSANDGGGHAGGKGLNGYAALAGYLEQRGFTVRRSRSEAAFKEPGLLVLTPPADADGAELDRIVGGRHLIGPTIVVTPKWITQTVPATMAQGRKGWVELSGTGAVEWRGFRDDVSLAASKDVKGASAGWRADRLAGPLPTASAVQGGSGRLLVPLVVSAGDGRVLAGYIDDGGFYTGLENMALASPASDADNERVFPLVLVFEPDLIDNYGLRNQASAVLGERLIRAAASDVKGDAANTVTFDLTLNGLARSTNLLTLAFTPPFLAATLCLLMAMVATGWRALLRFGPPRRAGRAIAFGKRALVANAAGLIRRSGRLHLIAPPYAQGARERLTMALALPRQADAGATEAAIDRALLARAPGSVSFSAVADRLRAARRPHDMLKAAQDLHALERTLTP